MTLGEIGGVTFLAACFIGLVWLAINALPGDTTRRGE